MLMQIIERFLAATICFVFVASPCIGQEFIFSAAEEATVPINVDLMPGDLVMFDMGSTSGSKFFDALTTFQTGNPPFDTANINAVFVRDNGNIVLSTDDNATLGSLMFTDEHVVEYNPNSNEAFSLVDFTPLLAAATMDDVDIDALHIRDNGNILLSLSNPGMLMLPQETITFQPDDIIEYDPVINDASVFLEGTTVFADPENITSFSINQAGNFFFTTEEDAEVAGIQVLKGDIVEYNPTAQTATKKFDGNTFNEERKKVDAVHVPAPVPEPQAVTFFVMGLASLVILARRNRH